MLHPFSGRFPTLLRNHPAAEPGKTESLAMTLTKMIPVTCLVLLLAGCGQSRDELHAQAISPDINERLRAVDLVREQKPAVAIPILTKALSDSNFYVRRNSARSLTKFGPSAKEAVPSLQTMLRDSEPSVRLAAAKALKEIDPTAGPDVRNQ